MSGGISVVIPSRNRAGLLRATLDCVLGQSLAPHEVLVVDDGSTDHTADVVKSFADRRLRHIRLEHRGHLVARNVGLRAARSELVAFCDSDDLWQPPFLEAVRQLWQRAPDLTASYCNFAIVKDGHWSRTTKFREAPVGFWDGLRSPGSDLGRIDQSFAERLIDFQPFFPTGMVVHRRRFSALGGWDDGVGHVVGSDFATALRAVAHPPIGLIQRPLVGIRKHPGNLSRDAEAMNLGNARVLEHVLETRPEMASLAAKIKASIGARRRDALAAAFVRQDMGEVRRIYRLLPPNCRDAATWLKVVLASLPGPMADRISGIALALGSLKASLLAAAAANPWGVGARAGRVHQNLSGNGFTSVISS